jgi:hypothetical protein
MKFNSIYYIHIPKTGGRWFISNVHKNITYLLKTYDINDLNNFLEKKSKIHRITHWGWIPEISDQTLIYTSIREPAAQICSLFSHRFMTNAFKLKDASVEEIKSIMFDHLNTYKEEYSNIQSKNISYYNIFGINDYGVNLPPADLNISMEKIKRINKIFLIEEKKRINKEECINQIINLIDKEITINNKKLITNNFYSNSLMSNLIFNSLNQNEIEKLNNFSSIDYSLYLYVKENKNV